MRIVKRILSVLVVLVLFVAISVPLVNNLLAEEVAGDVREIRLPNDTEYIESFAKAGKFVGNGNGMQYVGGILIKSKLSKDTLQSYYSGQGLECIVENQLDKCIQFDHRRISLKDDVEGDDYYVVYTWGEKYCNSIIADLDIRGH